MPTPEMVDLSRTNLAAFVKTTMPSYSIGWVHREICGRLMRFLNDVLNQKSPRLILTMPPRHGKSQLVSKHFPAWCFGVAPDISIISATWGSDLAMRVNKDVQRIMDSSVYGDIFPNSTLSRKGDRSSNKATRTTDLFEIPGYAGSFRSTGVGGGITGMGCDILNIDDPLKDRRDANSATVRQRIWDWYTSTAYTRLSPGGGVLVTLTRWHEDDLVGRLIDAMQKEDGDQWTIINYPAIAEHDEKHRKEGEALHPERYPLKMLERIRTNVGSYDWNSLYQQHPSPLGGGMYKTQWFNLYDDKDLPPFFDKTFMSWDMTFKNTEGSDFVACVVFGKKGARYYVLDIVYERMDFVTTLSVFCQMAQKWPQAIAKYVEDKANGTAIINVLQSKVQGIIPVNPRESKVARAAAVTPVFEAGNVYLPKNHPLTDKLIDQHIKFPNDAHDDLVDAMDQGISQTMEQVSIWDTI